MKRKLPKCRPSLYGALARPAVSFCVDDFADACVFVLKNYSSSEFIDIGFGGDLTIAEFARTVIRATPHHKGTANPCCTARLRSYLRALQKKASWPFSELRLQLITPSTLPNELNTTLTPHSMIHGDACFSYFKIWGILGHRVEAGRLALPLRSFAPLGEVQKSCGAGRQARSGGRLGQRAMAIAASGKNRIMIYGPKLDGTYIVESTNGEDIRLAQS
jgi:hypothetical protein